MTPGEYLLRLFLDRKGRRAPPPPGVGQTEWLGAIFDALSAEGVLTIHPPAEPAPPYHWLGADAETLSAQ